MATTNPKAAAAPARYRFEGVVVDEVARRLVIDGRAVHCSQRAFQLLALLCRAPGRTLSRTELLDLLWPGGQVVADESLTQAVFRARAVLGRYADRVVTVRGVGFRLDAEVEALEGPTATVAVAPSRAAMDAPAAPATQATDSGATSPWRWRLAVLLAVLGLLVVVLAWRGSSAPAPASPIAIDVGYALTEAELHAGHPETPRLLREAFAHEGAGDRARARALLETVHASDPVTPVPATFLALWAVGGGDNALADRWLAEAGQRARPLADPLATALLAYTRAEREGRPQEILRRAGALLDLRPGAWQLRLARAHLLNSEGLREAALGELMAIDFGELDHRKLVTALADRASLGDVEGAFAAYREIVARQPPSAALAYLGGRIAWSRGDFDAASADFRSAVELARREARFDLVNRSLANLGAIAVMQRRDDEAIARLEAARSGMVESGWLTDEIDLSLMLAQLHAFRGATDEVERELARAERVMAQSGVEAQWPVVRLYRERLAPRPGAAPVDAPALAAMLQAHRALAAGDVARASEQLRRATGLVGPSSELHDELRWLGDRLGVAMPEAGPIDPPYPPLARLTTRAAIDRGQEARP